MTPALIFYTSVIYSLETRFGETPSKTAHVTGTEIVFDEDFFTSLSPKERLGLMLHEVRHITDMHHFRRKGRDARLFNVAGDYVINNELVSEGFTLPQGGLVDSKYAGMSVEEVYEDLVQNAPDADTPMPDLQQGNGTGDDGQDSEDGAGDGMPQPLNDNGLTSAEQEVHDKIQDILIQAVQTSQKAGEKAVGNIPASIQRMVDEWLKPVIPWQTLLQRYATSKARDDYSWNRPNRRYLAHKLYMPHMESESVGPIHFFLDASCSVSDEMFSMQASQIKWVHKNIKPSELRIVVFNTRIVDEFIFKPNEPMNVVFTGRGGTHCKEVAEYIKDNKAEANFIFTDAYMNCSYIEELKKEEVVWLVYDNPHFQAKGQKTIHIPAT